MKNVTYFVVLIVFFGLTGFQTQLNNRQLEALYLSIPDHPLGFSSKDYSITDYEGNKKIILPTGDGLNFVSNVSGQDNIFFKPGGMSDGRGIETSSLGKTVRVCYKDKPFFQARAIMCSSDDFLPIKFTLSEYTINAKSFVFIHGDHDFQGEIGGMYVDGNLITQKVMVKGGVPFLPNSVKKVGKKIIVRLESANRASLYCLFNENTNQLILPIDYETIKNSWIN